jgi:hypothetical protein
MTITPEMKEAVERAGSEPVRLEDPETHMAYVMIREDLYQKLREAIPESDFTLHEFEELIAAE